MMAIGTRVYVQVPGRVTVEGYYAGLKARRSFVTTGPLLRFTVAAARPGDIVKTGGEVPFELTVGSALPFDRAEIVVNGEIAWSGAGLTKPAPRPIAAPWWRPAAAGSRRACTAA